MDQSSYKQKNWQWRIIIWASLILIFAKPIGQWLYQLLGFEQMYAATTTVIKKVGLNDNPTPASTTNEPASRELIIEVKNDTPNDYTVDTRVSSGQIDLANHTFTAGETKRITVKPYENMEGPVGRGDIIFLSAPISGSNNQICQEIHTLNYDLKYINQIKQPIELNLSAINSRMECKESSGPLPSNE